MRPDALAAFEDPGVRKALGRYVAVSKDEKPAKFLSVRAAPIDVDLDADTGALWEEHDRVVASLDYESTAGSVPPKSLMDLKIELAHRMLKECHFCERRCGIDRTARELGFCGTDLQSRLSSEFLHMGEEACLVPSHTFFFIGCTFHCVYCQNWTISRQVEKGVPITGKEMAKTAKRRRLVEKSRNINLVGGSPTPNTHTILEMLKELDVNVPIVWNSNMYMSDSTMRLLDGCMDVYLTDFKYGNSECADRLSKAENYWEIATRNHLLAKKNAELLIRHLVLPNHVECCSSPIIEWIAKNFSDSVRLNIMAQYRPEFEAYKMPDITRGVTGAEMEEAFALARKHGLNLD
jgi:putative pyruvate formate lyase activating enzyme